MIRATCPCIRTRLYADATAHARSAKVLRPLMIAAYPRSKLLLESVRNEGNLGRPRPWQIPPATLSEARVNLSTMSDDDIKRKMDEFNDLFVTAREEMEFAGESKETTYFDEEAAAAKEAVDEAVAVFDEVLNSVDEKKRGEIMRGSGLRVEQLKAELDQLLASDDH